MRELQRAKYGATKDNVPSTFPVNSRSNRQCLRGASGSDSHPHAVDDKADNRVLQQSTDFDVNGSSSLLPYYKAVWVMRVK